MSRKIYELEMKLLSRSVRQSPKDLGHLLSDDFVEFASSGQVYTKQDVIRSLQDEPGIQFKVSEFETRKLSEEVTLATYRVTKTRVRDSVNTESLRCSLWQLSDEGWRLVFHQGTPIA